MKNKVQLIGTIVGVLLFIALIAGFTYAYLLTRTEKTLTTGSGKFSIDYAIVQNITASSLSPSTSKTDGLHGIVKAKLSTGSVSGKFNIYITPTTIAGLNTSDVLRYEVYVMVVLLLLRLVLLMVLVLIQLLKYLILII